MIWFLLKLAAKLSLVMLQLGAGALSRRSAHVANFISLGEPLVFHFHFGARICKPKGQRAKKTSFAPGPAAIRTVINLNMQTHFAQSEKERKLAANGPLTLPAAGGHFSILFQSLASGHFSHRPPVVANHHHHHHQAAASRKAAKHR